MTTRMQRQQAREQESIEQRNVRWAEWRDTRTRELDAIHGEGYAKSRWVAAEAARLRLAAPRKQATRDQLAVVARHLELIIGAKNPKTGDVIVVKERAVALVDVMHREKQLPMELWHAAAWFRERWATANGYSRISSYDGYTDPSDPANRCPTTLEMQQAYEELKEACIATFGTVRNDKRWALDEQLMQLVIPAILDDTKKVTQGRIGAERTAYTGAAQKPAAGGAIVAECLHRLCLHLTYRER